jgi:hypothetical protein
MLRANLRSLQEALEQAGFEIPYATLQLYSGLDGDQTLQIIAPDLEGTQRKQILQARVKIYETKYLHRSLLRPIAKGRTRSHPEEDCDRLRLGTYAVRGDW